MGRDAELEYSHDDDDDHISLLPKKEASYYSSSKKTAAWPIILPWSLVCVLVGALLWLTSQYPRQAGDPSQAFYSPAQSQIEYHNSTFVRAFGRQLSEYQGWPSADIDQKWDDLYDRGALVGISAEDNAQLPNPSENVPQPGREAEYLVGFDVFHQLHCLNMIRKSMYPRRYNMSMVVADGRVHYGRWMHLDHCIESLRQSVMCHADISTIYYKWLPKSKNLQPMLGGVHTCRNFSKIRDWAWERGVEIPDIHRHVENGKIVAFSPDWDKNFDPEDPAWNAPDGWAYTAEDL